MAFDSPRLGGFDFQNDSDSLVDVLVEPKAGKSDDEVVILLEQGGAACVEILSPGFISAQVPYQMLSSLESVAYVEEQAERKLRF